jgi:EpsI family protein
MIGRRELFIGAACASSVAVGNLLRPHRSVVMLQKGAKLDALIPKTFGDWVSQDVGDPLAINGPGTLSAQIYNEIVGRNYVNKASQSQVTVLMAYGARQSDDLQLHRPEICYPAFGFTLERNEPADIPLRAGTVIPARRLTAASDDHAESIVYWTRVGESLPQDGGGQRKARFEIALQGIIPDGVLCRFSAAGDYPELRWQEIYGFVGELLGAMKPADRRILIGTQRANVFQTQSSRPPLRTA